MVERAGREVYTHSVMTGYASQILWPMLAHVGLIVILYAWLTVVRVSAVRSGEATYSCYVFGRDEPPHITRISRNLSNQFELPVIFYAMVVLLIATDEVNLLDVIAAWVFILGRVIHTLVQTRTDNVPLRGNVFVINFVAVLVLVGHVAYLAVEGFSPIPPSLD
jgi:hypothetical protein